MSDVFISYSHKDRAFAFQLREALLKRTYTVWIDNTDVLPAGNFRDDIKVGIQEASAFIFILSPDSLLSEECRKELTYAQECGKKLIPIYYRPLGSKNVPQSLHDLDCILASPPPELLEGETPFNYMLKRVVIALQTDHYAWRKSAQWLGLAVRWQEAQTPHSTEQSQLPSRLPVVRATNLLSPVWMRIPRKLWEQETARELSHALLLRGKELREAENWLKEAERWRREGTQQEPQPLPLHTQFIRESRRAATSFIFVSLLSIFALIGVTGGGAFLLLHIDPNLVTTTQDDGTGSLRWVLANALPTQPISFAPQVRGTITLINELSINKALTVRGPGEKVLALRSLGAYGIRILPGARTVSISDLSFTGATVSPAVSGGFVVRVEHGGSLHLDHVTIARNDRGGISNQGTLIMSHSIISNNSGSSASNRTGPGIGGIENTSGNMTITTSSITGNASLLSGGVSNSSGTMTISHAIIVGNRGGYYTAGGLSNFGGTITLDHSIVSDNASYAAGGISNNAGTMRITHTTISKNTSLSSGGNAASIGALVNSSGHMTILASTISGNTSVSPGSAGANASVGGIENSYSGTTTIANSTISGNTTVPSAYAIRGIFVSSGLMTILFCTIAENRGSPGILVAPSFYSNESYQGSLKVKNTILVTTPVSLAPGALQSTIQSEGYNLVERREAALFHQPGDSILQDSTALFQGTTPHLAENGGPVQTIALRSDASNPASNAIPIAACHIAEIKDTQTHIYVDQRGMPRPGRGRERCSIGAYEAA